MNFDWLEFETLRFREMIEYHSHRRPPLLPSYELVPSQLACISISNVWMNINLSLNKSFLCANDNELWIYYLKMTLTRQNATMLVSMLELEYMHMHSENSECIKWNVESVQTRIQAMVGEHGASIQKKNARKTNYSEFLHIFLIQNKICHMFWLRSWIQLNIKCQIKLGPRAIKHHQVTSTSTTYSEMKIFALILIRRLLLSFIMQY